MEANRLNGHVPLAAVLLVLLLLLLSGVILQSGLS
jgi:hypothetical protein